ncbi:hypothetical protein BC832DRAFT_427771 [Gaertneriomyces semiglobifer]|nr:hypothetical protein BC832DRAFT_427771 [Gaertneriomyces semiglobifer]
MIPPPSSLDLATGDLSELIRKHKLEQANVIKSIARRTSLLTQPSGATLGVESSKLTRSLSSAERPTPDVMDASSSSPQRMTSLSDEEIAGKTKPRLLAIEQLKRAARSEHSDGSKTGNVAAKDESLRHVQSDSDEDLDSKATSSSLSTAGKSYKEMDPGVVGKLVFEDAVPDIPPELASEIIGKPDPYHQAVLHNYMECFNFANTEIDEAFRQFALRLYIAGESQVITRIMTAFASRYWDCNPQFHDLYPTMDYIDVIVMGMMVVNTDYHRANVGAKTGNRMTKKLWVGSMMSSLNELVAKEPKNEGLGDKAIRAWQKRLEDVLKKIFDKIVKVPLPQRDLTSRSLDLSSTHSDASGTASPASPRGTRIGLRRDESSLSLASTLSTGTMFSIFDTKRRGTFGSLGFRRKMERTDSRSYLASMARPDDNGSGHHPLALSLDSQLHIAAGSGSPSLGRHSVGGSLTQPRSSTSSWGGTNSASLSRTPSTAEPYLEGELIRKHLKEKDDTKAKNRRWVKFLCRMELSNATSSDGTLELFMYKFEKRADQDATGFQEDEQHGQHGHRTDEVASNKMGRVSSETARTARTFRQIANAPPQTFNLLHALAFPLPPPGYNSYRPHVFTLRLLDGSTYLFHCRDKETVQDWVCTINLWAARKSKEPFLGSGGNSEFGWGPVLEVQRMREMRATGSHSPGPGNLEPSPQDSSPDTLGPAANSTYAASMRSFASTGSEESGRSVATVPSGFVPGTSQRRMTPVSKGDKEFDRKLRRLKIVEWVPPVPAGRVMSTQPEEAQVLVWSRQQENVGKELEEHSYYRDPIEKLVSLCFTAPCENLGAVALKLTFPIFSMWPTPRFAKRLPQTGCGKTIG